MDPKILSEVANLFAVGAPVACLYLCIYAASKCKGFPRQFTAIALFALNWAMLVVYYNFNAIYPESSLQLNFLPAFSGFLLIYVGVILSREATSRLHPNRLRREILHLNSQSLSILKIIVIPSSLAIIQILSRNILDGGDSESLNRVFQKVSGPLNDWLGSALSILGFYRITNSIAELYEGDRARKKYLWIMSLILVPYAVADISFDCIDLANIVQHRPSIMPAEFKIAFAVFKTAFTIFFLFVILTRPVKGKRPKLRWAFQGYWWTTPNQQLITAEEAKT